MNDKLKNILKQKRDEIYAGCTNSRLIDSADFILLLDIVYHILEEVELKNDKCISCKIIDKECSVECSK